MYDLDLSKKEVETLIDLVKKEWQREIDKNEGDESEYSEELVYIRTELEHLEEEIPACFNCRDAGMVETSEEDETGRVVETTKRCKCQDYE